MAVGELVREEPAASGPAPSPATGSGVRPRQFRTDIEGFRAVAVILVVAFHAGLPHLTGGYVGVDAFYVISGFLITGLLVDEIERTGTISFRRFYARRVRRLLPMAMLVLLAVAIGMQFFTPPAFRPTVRLDALSAAFDYSNWQFALESVNYLTLGANENPVLHYWSLSVEEQFYLLWPLLLLVAVRLARRGRLLRTARAQVGAAIIGIGIASFIGSVLFTAAEPAQAYFATPIRAWEFAIGGGVALLAPRLLRVRRSIAVGAGVVGIALVLGSAIIMGSMTEFPGTAALWPALGAGLVIAAGCSSSQLGVGWLLSLQPVRYVGRISYAWYLWHWPCLVFAQTAHWAPANGQIGWAMTSLVVLVSFLLAAVSYRLVEVPTRHAAWLSRGPRRTFLLGGAMTTTAALAALVTGGPIADLISGFGPVRADAVGVTVPLAATPLEAEASTPYSALHGCHLGYGSTAPASGCVFGDVRGRQTAVLIGDSHAAQWFPALDRLAIQDQFRLIVWTKSGCPLTLGVHIYLAAIGRDYTECETWQRNVIRQLKTMPRPSLVILGRTSTYLPQVLTPDGNIASSERASKLWGGGAAAAVSALRHVASRVVLLRDTPQVPYNVPACISWDPDDAVACDFSSTTIRSDGAEYAAERAAGVPPSVYADPQPVVCPNSICPVEFYGQIVYRDTNHLTAAFVLSRWRAFAMAIGQAVQRRPI